MDNTKLTTIDKEGDALNKSAAQAFERIMGLRMALDNEGRYNSPLFVLAGENHQNLPEHLHHMVLIDALSRSCDNFAVSLEIKHNVAPNLEKIEHSADFLTVGKAVFNLNYAIDELETPYCNFTTKLLLRQCKKGLEQRKLSCVFSDAASKQKGYMRALDETDPSTYASLIINDATNANCSTTSALGTAVRDHHMFTKMKDHAALNNARIVYHCTGADHLDGLSRHFSDASLPYLNLVSEQCLTYAPSDEMSASMHILEGLADVSAHYIPSMPHASPPDMLADIVTQEEEQRYVYGKLDYLGLSHLK
jgi:hypothetical protein